MAFPLSLGQLMQSFAATQNPTFLGGGSPSTANLIPGIASQQFRTTGNPGKVSTKSPLDRFFDFLGSDAGNFLLDTLGGTATALGQADDRDQTRLIRTSPQMGFSPAAVFNAPQVDPVTQLLLQLGGR